MFVLGTKLPTWKNYRKKALMNLHVLPFCFMMALILCCHLFLYSPLKRKGLCSFLLWTGQDSIEGRRPMD